MTEFDITLSEAQKRVIKNVRMNANVSLIAGSLGVIGAWQSGNKNIFDLFVHFIVVGATAQMISNTFFPVNPEKMLDFDKQKIAS